MQLLIRLTLALCLACILQRGRAVAADRPYLVVLGVAQDAGYPQAGTANPVWDTPEKHRYAASLGLIDPETGMRWIFDATPDFKYQFRHLQTLSPGPAPSHLDGVFLTHAHMGHYVGLAHLGHEAIGARGTPVFAMPRMASFLSGNGPWDQLVRYGNIQLVPLSAGEAVQLTPRLSVIPLPVPHRDEYSEVVAFRIQGPHRTALFLPDIDSWEKWDAMGTRLENLLAEIDLAFVDGTFFSGEELPGRDLSTILHPLISHSMERFSALPKQHRSRLHFIHLNHTNPVLIPSSPAHKEVLRRGFRVSRQFSVFPL